MTRTVQDLVAHARSRISEVTIDDVADGVPDAVLIDVREPEEFAQGHLQGAINIPRGVLEFQIDAHPGLIESGAHGTARRERPVVVYCRSGGRSALAALSLQDMGYRKVHSMAGGITAWVEAGQPVSSTP